MGRKVKVIGIEKDGTRKTHKVAEEDVEKKCVKRYDNRFWVDSDEKRRIKRTSFSTILRKKRSRYRSNYRRLGKRNKIVETETS